MRAVRLAALAHVEAPLLGSPGSPSYLVALAWLPLSARTRAWLRLRASAWARGPTDRRRPREAWLPRPTSVHVASPLSWPVRGF